MMDRQELVEGYVRGDITRRTFVRRLTVTGISLAAALSYAELLRPEAAHAAPGEDYYENLYEDELPPDLETHAPSGITHDGLTAWAMVDPNLQTTVVFFEYGPPGGARQSSPSVAISGDGDRPVSVAIGGLMPSTAYVVRGVAENRSGRTVGSDVAFTTGAAPAAAVATAAVLTPPPPPDTRGTTFRSVRVRTTLRQLLRTGVLPIEVTPDEDALLELIASLRMPVRDLRAAVTRTRKVTVATGKAAARGGQPTTVKLKLRRAGRKALKKRKKATLQLEIRATDRARNRSVRRLNIRI